MGGVKCPCATAAVVEKVRELATCLGGAEVLLCDWVLLQILEAVDGTLDADVVAELDIGRMLVNRGADLGTEAFPPLLSNPTTPCIVLGLDML